MRQKKKRKKRVFKKFILLLICIIIGCNLINHILREDILSKINEKKGNISSYYVYGNHFNVSGSIELKNIDDSKILIISDTHYGSRYENINYKKNFLTPSEPTDSII